jgi:hypothetical protein
VGSALYYVPPHWKWIPSPWPKRAMAGKVDTNIIEGINHNNFKN